MSNTRRIMHRGDVDSAIVDCGDNVAVGTSTVTRGILRGGETVSSVATSIFSKPSGADDPTIGSASILAANTECNGRIVGSGEGFTLPITMASDQALGEYVIECAITTSTSRTLNRCIEIEVVDC